MDELIATILKQYQGEFMTVGLAGSVSVGKSTLAETLASRLTTAGVNSQVISTDHFLMSNADLQSAGLFDQKGFPQTYHLDQLADLVQAFRAGKKRATLPIYQQVLADIVPDQDQVIDRPQILIIEGVVALQLPKAALDLAIYIDADLADIKDWYLARNLMATFAARNHPDSWRYQYHHWPIDDFANQALAVWDRTNQVNLDRYIHPSAVRADLVVHLDHWHQITAVAPQVDKA
ncbi:type I pantothenate kinase [Leuconostocaceae bacterium ESL0723]|nr:type I pantothenate kinase [Leuconostocaceae bacterium ESL0723]